MERKIGKMYCQDIIISIVSAFILLGVLVYVLFSLSLIIPESYIKIPVLAVGTVLGCYAVLITFAVIKHLKDNKTELYLEEIKFSNYGND